MIWALSTLIRKTPEMIKTTLRAAFVAAFCLPQALLAQDKTRTTIYVGAGTQDDSGSLVSDGTPFSLGIYARPSNRPLIIGFDYGREGSMLDSTGGGEEVRKANSYNLLLGTTLFEGRNYSVNGIALLGMRETFSDCPDSFLGFECYADRAPTTEYDVNYGAMLTTTFDSFAVGLRATGESTQVTFGMSF